MRLGTGQFGASETASFGFNSNSFRLLRQGTHDRLPRGGAIRGSSRPSVAIIDSEPTDQADPSRSLSFAFGTALPAPFASFADRCTSVSDNPSQIKSTFRMSRS